MAAERSSLELLLRALRGRVRLRVGFRCGEVERVTRAGIAGAVASAEMRSDSMVVVVLPEEAVWLSGGEKPECSMIATIEVGV